MIAIIICVIAGVVGAYLVILLLHAVWRAVIRFMDRVGAEVARQDLERFKQSLEKNPEHPFAWIFGVKGSKGPWDRPTETSGEAPEGPKPNR